MICKICNKTFSSRFQLSAHLAWCDKVRESNLKKYNENRKLIDINCLQCNKIIKSNKKYCSQKCHSLFKFNSESIPKIENGLVRNPSTLKIYLKQKNGNVCSICFNEGIHNGKELVLQLDHIDGNSDNNLPYNLRLLCPNCHSQTETFSNRQRKDTKRNRYLRRFKGY